MVSTHPGNYKAERAHACGDHYMCEIEITISKD